MAAYLGPPAPLSVLLYDSSHSLESQAYRPRELLSGSVNVDGTGIAWWLAGETEPLLYVTERPPWSDANLPRLAPRLRSGLQLAAVRSATPGLPFGPDAVAPFVEGSVAMAHNGFIAEFKNKALPALLPLLSPTALAQVGSLTDSRLLFVLFLQGLEQTKDLLAALVWTLKEVAATCRRLEISATLNLIVAETGRIVASRASWNAGCNSLYHFAEPRPGAQLVASEPLDDERSWTAIPTQTLIELTDEGLRTLSLEL